MKTSSSIFLAALVASALCACGGTSSNDSDTTAGANAPSYDLVALSVDDSDAAAPAATSVSSELTLAQPAADDPCHPHLFSRTRQVVLNLNILSYKLLHHVGEVIANNPIAVGDTDTWTRVGDAGLQRKFTLTKTAPGSFTYELDFAAAGSTDFVKVFSGDLARTVTSAADAGTSATAVAASETTGTMTFDYTALASVVTTEKESGQIAYTFDITVDPSQAGQGKKKSETIAFTNFMFGPNDPHGARNGNYVFLGEPGVGGTLVYQDSLALLCPANPNALDADTNTEARWYLGASDGLIHGRADAKATGGQITAGDTFLGVTCHIGPAPTAANENAYWMMKLEDASGATVQGSAHEATAGATPCDPIFGAVPALDNNATDWTFGGTLSFPGEW